MSKKISRRNRRIRNLLLVISMMMVVAMASVGVTVAWLTAESDKVVNTFTASDINITLTEEGASQNTTTNAWEKSFKMIPGSEIAKDPKVTIEKGSEACYVFVKIDKNDTYDIYMEQYVVADGWTRLNGTGDYGKSEIFYKEQPDLSAATADASYYVLAGSNAQGMTNGRVVVKEEVNKEQMEDLLDKKVVLPTLTFTAYACQMANIEADTANSKSAAQVAWDTIGVQ